MLINANVEIVPFKSRESFFFGSVYVFKVPDNNRGRQHAQHVLALATT